MNDTWCVLRSKVLQWVCVKMTLMTLISFKNMVNRGGIKRA